MDITNLEIYAYVWTLLVLQGMYICILHAKDGWNAYTIHVGLAKISAFYENGI